MTPVAATVTVNWDALFRELDTWCARETHRRVKAWRRGTSPPDLVTEREARARIAELHTKYARVKAIG